MTQPRVSLEEVLQSPSLWLSVAADAIAKDDASRLQRAREELHALGYVLLTPGQVESLNEPDDDQDDDIDPPNFQSEAEAPENGSA